MSDSADVLQVVGEWVAKAENDLRNAAHTLRIETDCPTDTICFHAQQCVEKYVKAMLICRGVPFPKSHDLSILDRMLPEEWRLNLTPEQMRRFTDYGTITRYPGEYEPITMLEARNALKTARQVRADVRAILPKESLRRRRR